MNKVTLIVNELIVTWVIEKVGIPFSPLTSAIRELNTLGTEGDSSLDAQKAESKEQKLLWL